MGNVLGIDTSSYTTSLCVIDDQGQTVADIRKPLSVPAGQIGLRQSVAVFEHLKQLPELASQLRTVIEHCTTVSVAARPRSAPDSYLPVFRAGYAAAEIAAAACQAQLIITSHQEGHLACVDEFLSQSHCLGVHVSGGTTDIVLITTSDQNMEIKRIGGGSDLHAGQFVDRIGQKLGLGFPAGPELDQMAIVDPATTLPVAVNDGVISFSGPHSAALRLLEAGTDPELVAGSVLSCIARSLERGILDAIAVTGSREVVVGGGVAASRIVRRILSELPERMPGLVIRLASQMLCTDNAVGVARIGLHRRLSGG